MRIDELDTPAAIVDLDVLEANISALQRYMDEHQITNRPHVKTHKIPEIARMQVEAGAVGITCQKLGEAEVMADAGIRDIFIPYNLVGKTKLARLVSLMKRATISVTADSEAVAHGYSHAMPRTGLELPVLVECDTGMGRCGAQTPQAAATLAGCIASLPGLRFGGLMTYPSSENANEFMAETKALLVASGLTAKRVSGGGTKYMYTAHTFSEINEHRAGEYVYGHRQALLSGLMSEGDCSFRVLTTVVSRPTTDRGILDGGSKTFSSDTCPYPGYGYIVEYPRAEIYKLSEEHGNIDFSKCDHKPEVGERLTVIPNHCCPVSNLFDQVVGHRNGEVEVTWPVAARGMIQ